MNAKYTYTIKSPTMQSQQSGSITPGQHAVVCAALEGRLGADLKKVLLNRGNVPLGATHMDEKGNYYSVPPAGHETGVWGLWDGDGWVQTEATSMLPAFKLQRTDQ